MRCPGNVFRTGEVSIVTEVANPEEKIADHLVYSLGLPTEYYPFKRCQVPVGHPVYIKTPVFKIYRVSQEERAKLREGVPYFKLYRYNPKHLCPKLNVYGDKGQRKVWSFCGSTYGTWFA